MKKHANRHKLICWKSYAKPNIKHKARTPWLRATQMYVHRLIRKNDFDTKLMLHELTGITSALPARPQHSVRGLTPRQRAETILANIIRQRRFTAYHILIAALAVEVQIYHDPASPAPHSDTRFRYLQVARAVFHLLKSDIKVYERESLRRPGVILKDKVKRRMYLQSRWVSQRLWEVIEPCYRYFLADHHRHISSFKAMRDHKRIQKMGKPYSYRRPWSDLQPPSVAVQEVVTSPRAPMGSIPAAEGYWN